MTETTGTPVPPQEGANADASGTPAAQPEGGNAGLTAEEKAELERLKSEKGQWLAEKTNYEEAKRRLQELEQASQSTPPTGYDPQNEALLRSYQDLAERDPAVAQIITAVAQSTQAQLQRQQAELRWYRELDSVPATDRAEVEARARRLGVSPAWAQRDLDAERYTKTQKELEAERQRLAVEREALNRPKTVSTVASPSPPAMPRGDEITAEEYARACDRAEKGDAEARRLLDRYDSGQVRIRTG